MKKNILLVICAVVSLQCCGQSPIKNKDFAKFVEKFSIAKFPINLKKTKKVFNVDNEQANITKEEAIKFLGRTDESMIYFFELYDSDEDIIKGYEKMECIPGVMGKYYTNNFIACFTIEGKINSDTTLIYLYTLSYEGKTIDKILIGGQFTRENDWKDVVFLTNNTFKIFDYKSNLENYNIKGGVYYTIDEKQPKTIVETSDYQIDENGKITLIKTHPKQYLKERVAFYRTYQKDSDDPMNDF